MIQMMREQDSKKIWKLSKKKRFGKIQGFGLVWQNHAKPPKETNKNYLVVSNHLKHISQIGFPQVVGTIKHI